MDSETPRQIKNSVAVDTKVENTDKNQIAKEPRYSAIKIFFYVSVAVSLILLIGCAMVFFVLSFWDVKYLEDRVSQLECKENFETKCEAFLLSLDRKMVVDYLND
mmetsp:Transcript_4389/g.6929  ORF Transcript_4389/g.6929 Transcript_4389/m.6929 type:complete len:105 (-) Transcript_4389:2752-3066(-)